MRLVLPLASVLPILLLTACKDEELETKAREQELRIATLQAQVDSLSSRLGPEEGGDAETELKEAKAALDSTTARVEALRTELAELTAQREAMEEEFEAYRKKYPIPE